MLKKHKLAVYEDDELYLILRGRTYYLHGTFDGRRIRKACGTADLARAKLFLENTKRELESGWREEYDRSDQDWAMVAKIVHDRQKHGAIKRGIPWELRPAHIYALMKGTGFRCAVSGIPFAKRSVSNGQRDPWGPSIDRIENRHGYMVDNIRVVCIAANIALGDWGMDALLRLSRGVVRTSNVVSQEPEILTHPANNSDAIDDISLISLDKTA